MEIINQLTLILTSVVMGAVGQILLKAGANNLGEYNLDFTHIITSIWTILKVPQILIGMVFFGSSLVRSNIIYIHVHFMTI